MRAEFRIWHDKGDFYHIMFDQSTLQRYRVDEFPIASELINRMMKTLLPLLKNAESIHKKLFQIDYLSTLSNKIICKPTLPQANSQKNGKALQQT